MKKRLSRVFGAIVLMLTATASMGCMLAMMDEPFAPASLRD